MNLMNVLSLPRSLAIALAMLLMLPLVAAAQEATVTGNATDSTGGVLPGVTIRAVHDATGNSFETVTDERGQYRLPVRTGAFHLTATLEGFAAPVRNFELLLGQEATVNLVMAPSTLQESVTVTGESPLVDFNQSKLGGNIDPRQMQELPVNGRNWQDLAVLSRAAVPTPPQIRRPSSAATPIRRSAATSSISTASRSPTTSSTATVIPVTAATRSPSSSSLRTGSMPRRAVRLVCR
jgi:hypothetical protein